MRQQISEALLFPGSRPEDKDFRALHEFDSIDSWSKIRQDVFFHKGLLTWKPGFLLISMEEVERPSPYIFLDGLLILLRTEYYIWKGKILTEKSYVFTLCAFLNINFEINICLGLSGESKSELSTEDESNSSKESTYVNWFSSFPPLLIYSHMFSSSASIWALPIKERNLKQSNSASFMARRL